MSTEPPSDEMPILDEIPIIIVSEDDRTQIEKEPDGDERREPRRRSVMPRIQLALGCAAAVAGVTLFVIGREYYVLPISERHDHAYHDLLRSSGSFGLLLGVAGTALMLLNLSYLLRKRLLSLRWIGTLRSWMGFHVLTGLVAPGMIALHTAFTLHSALGILAFSAMLIVVLTGIVGRYIYAHVPRSLEGRELELDEVKRRLGAYKAQLVTHGLDASTLTAETPDQVRDEIRVDGADSEHSILRALTRVALGNRQSRREYRKVAATVRSVPALRARSKHLLPLVRRLCKERLWLSRYQELRWLMGSWRFFHRWLAIVMLLIAFFHVVIAFRFGDLWIMDVWNAGGEG